MSDRDELAGEIGAALANAYDDDSVVTVEEPVADVLWSAGWRKMPSISELTDCIISVDDQRDTDLLVAAILALLDGPTETGGK